MPVSKRTLRFKAGDLVVVRSNFKIHGGGTWPHGPHIPGHRTIRTNALEPDRAFLVLTDSKESSHRQNRKIYMEVMTESGPRLTWASPFKMKKGASEQ